jgi:fibronectin type 3 domain-containing protein
VTNTGNANLSISQVAVSGSGFSMSGSTPPLTLSPGKGMSVSLDFAPTGYGAFTGSVSVVSNAANSPATISLTGSSHANILSWDASTSTVLGYNVYRGTQSGGPYGTELNSSLIPTTTFTDTSVQAGQTFFYVVTAVGTDYVESAYSNQMSGTVPSP